MPRGPRTLQGKARSSRNAVKHGLLAQQIVIDHDDPDEDPLDFTNLTEALIVE